MHTLILEEPRIDLFNNPYLNEEKPIDIPTVLNRAELLIQADYLEQAMEELNLVLNYEPANTYALFVRYCCKLKLGLFDDADQDLALLNSFNNPVAEA